MNVYQVNVKGMLEEEFKDKCGRSPRLNAELGKIQRGNSPSFLAKRRENLSNSSSLSPNPIYRGSRTIIKIGEKTY